MDEHKTAIRELVYLSRLRQGELPLVTGRLGFAADARHVFRRCGDYCPFQCDFCDEQRVFDKAVVPGVGGESYPRSVIRG